MMAGEAGECLGLVAFMSPAAAKIIGDAKVGGRREQGGGLCAATGSDITLGRTFGPGI